MILKSFLNKSNSGSSKSLNLAKLKISTSIFSLHEHSSNFNRRSVMRKKGTSKASRTKKRHVKRKESVEEIRKYERERKQKQRAKIYTNPVIHIPNFWLKNDKITTVEKLKGS